ncbi:MAG: RNA-processing protein [Euryarchaeota archaeon]|nr:RNA-processing protein [Euryarchaeota archaeon]
MRLNWQIVCLGFWKNQSQIYNPSRAGIKERSLLERLVEPIARIPKDRIAVLIGKGGSTRKMIEEACGGKLDIDSRSGEVSVDWSGSDVDPIVKMKTPDVILAIGRGLSPSRAVNLLEDEIHLRMYDIREWVGRQPNQIRRMRSRLIGRNGLIRSRIEELSGTEIAIYGSSVIVIGDEMGLEVANPAIESILRGAEHGSVLHGLEKDRKRQRIRSRSLESYEERGNDSSTFDSLVPGLSAARRRRERRLKDSQIDPDDQGAVDEMLELAEDEEIIYEEE